MIFIDEMKNLKIYKKPVFLPYNDKDKKHGSLIYLLTPNYVSSIETMRLPYFINRQYFESYYFEKDVTRYLGKARLVKESTEELDTCSIHNNIDFDTFTAYAIRNENAESVDYSPTLEDALNAISAPSGKYSVYTHTIEDTLPIKIGEIENYVKEMTDYKTSYKWISFSECDIVEEQTDPLDNDYSYNVVNRFNIVSRDGSNNACVNIKGYKKPMRGRSSMIILKKVNGKLCAFCKILNSSKGQSYSSAGDISIPGGGWEPNEIPRDAAIREAGEEVFMIPKNVMHLGNLIEYSDSKDKVANWVKERINEEDWWYGYYSEIFVGMYDKPYNKHVDERDLDSFAKEGKWIPVEEVIKHKPVEYAEAIKKYIEYNNLIPTNEEALIEGNITDAPDIYYHKDEFDRGEINLCFITGLSGSGKTTLAKNITVEAIELDDIITNFNFSDKELKQYGDLVWTFFDGPGEKFRCQPGIRFDRFLETYNGLDYYEDCTKAFVAYAKDYARSHKRTKFVIEGVQIYSYISPDDLKDYAVYIKGTSATKSWVRSLLRDIKEAKTPQERYEWMVNKLRSFPRYFQIYEKNIDKFRMYFLPLTQNFSENYDEFLSENVEALDELVQSLIEISQTDKAKNEKLQPVFVVCSYTSTPMGKAIKAFTGDKYTHSLLALDPSLRDMYSFDFGKSVQNSDGITRNYSGFIVDNIDRYRTMASNDIKVYCLMVTNKIKKALEKSINWYKDNIEKTKYGFSNLIDFLLKSPKVTKDKELKMFCSEFVQKILNTVGIDISGNSPIRTAPGDIGKYDKQNNFFKVFEGKASEYDEKEIEFEIKYFKDTMTYKDLNAKKSKSSIFTEEDQPNPTPSTNADAVANQLSDKVKYMTRKIKMSGKKGLYKMNKQIRDIYRSLPDAESIQNSPSTDTSSSDTEQSHEEAVYFENILHTMVDPNIYYMLENEVIIFNEADKANDTALRNLLFADRIRSQKEVMAIYSKVSSALPFIKYTYPKLERYSGRNIFYDLSYYNEVFFRNNNMPIMKTLKVYTDFIGRLLDPKNVPNTYTKKTIIIPVLDWDTDPKTRTWLYREGINPISVIFNMMKYGTSDLVKLFGKNDVLFTGKNSYFKINFSELTKEQVAMMTLTFRNFVVKMKKGEQFSPDEVDSDNTESSKVIATNIMDKIEASKKVDLSNQYANINTIIANNKKYYTGNSPSNVAKSPTPKPIVKDRAKEDKETKAKEEAIKKEVDKTTTSTDITPEAKAKKAEDTIAINAKKDKLADGIANLANTSANTDDALDKLDQDDIDNIKNLIVDIVAEEDPTVKINKARAARMMQLNRDINDKTINNVPIRDLLSDESENKNEIPLPETSIEVDSPFKDQWSNLQYINFDKNYNINQDIVKMLNALSTKQYPIAIRNITVEDASTSEDYIDKYHIEFEDFRGKRFTVNLDIPKFKNNKYLILRGNKKTIQIQYFNMPILKTDRDTVQVISNYNKIFIRRFGNTAGKSIAFADRINKAANKYTGRTIKFISGDNSKISESYELPMDYIDLGSLYNTIETPNYKIYFNQKTLQDEYGDKIIQTKGLPYGYNKKDHSILYYIYADNGVPISSVIATLLCDEDSNFRELYDATRAAKKYVYSQASILNARIPLIIVCAYSEGLTTVLNKAGITYKLCEKLDSTTRHDPNYDWIQFADGYLIYQINYGSSLLMNGLKEIDTTAYSIDQINSKRIYTEMLDNYGFRKSDGVENFYECMLDPITLEVLRHYKLPTDYIQLLLYGNELLADNKFISHGDSSSRRVRRNELIAVKVYKALFNDAYSTYANLLRHNVNAAVFAIKESAVIDKFMTDTISSDLSVINCLNDVETSNAVTTKGESGMNAERAYTLDKRTYDSSMLGILGMSTGFAGNVGITRQATINMNIDTNRGYIKSMEGDTSKMNVSNSLTITEAMNPMGTTHDDPMRSAMTFVQTAKHQVRTVKSDPLLVTNGADEVLPYLTTDIFCKKAEENGKVIELTDNYMIVEYASGKHDYIDLGTRIEKNSDGGFYVNIQHVTNLKEGSKFKANDILSYDKDSFSKKALGESDKLTYNVGKLAKVAIINADDNFEDSALITSKLAECLSTDVIMKEERMFSKDTNIYNVAKVGQSVQQEDVLFETQTAYEEEDVNALLKSLAGDADTISRLNRRSVKSPVTGVVVGMKLYRSCEIEDMSPSLQKLFKDYESNIKKTQKHLHDYGIDDPTLLGSTTKLPTVGKLKNSPDSVLIEFYIQYHDIMGVGDKLTYWSANKGVVHDIIDSKVAPYTDYRPDEEISAFTGIASINKRQIASNLLIGALNKLCIELARSCREKLGIPYYDNELDL